MRRNPRVYGIWIAILFVAATLLGMPPARAQALSAADVQSIIAAAAVEANARSLNATIAVVDRVGNVLGVFDMPNGTGLKQLTVTTGRGIPAGNGLENVQQTFTAAGAVGSPSSRLSAISKAVTGAYLSSGGNAFTTRTASQIVQEHFNPLELFAPGGPLFGVQFSQLPCSDLSPRQATAGANPTGEISATVGPKRAPLGLSADPGGLPLYKNGQVVGGIGVEADNIYTIDPNIGDFDTSQDEIIALAGQFNFQPPIDIRANRIFVEGKSLRYIDISESSLLTNPSAANFGTINNVLGSLVAVQGYAAAATIDGQAYGTIASGFAPETTGIFNFVGNQLFVLYNNGTNPRFSPINSVTPAVGAGGLTANEVTTILGNALKIAYAGRAQIRRPLSSHIQVTVSVVDADGTVLGIAHTPDGPIFGTDVSLQKARTAAFFSNSVAAAYFGTFTSAILGTPNNQNANGVIISSFLQNVRNVLGPSALANGLAFADRSGGNLSRPFLPDGIDDAPAGPFSYPITTWSPFNTGLQLDTVTDNLVEHILFADGAAATDTNATCTDFAQLGGAGTLTRLSNGFQIFPGSVPIYRNGVVIGGIGVSGDGIDQDDMTSFLGLHDASIASGTGFGNAPASLRADNLSFGGSHLRYVNCPFKPFLHSRVRNVCAGK